jgi:hypothetical protein
MGQSKQTCPHCWRPPGGKHHRDCPRAMVRVEGMRAGLVRTKRRLVLRKVTPLQQLKDRTRL